MRNNSANANKYYLFRIQERAALANVTNQHSDSGAGAVEVIF